MLSILRRIGQGFLRWVREPRILWRSETTALRTTIEVRTWLPFPAFLLALIWYMAAPSQIAMISALTLAGMLLGSFLWGRTVARKTHGWRRLRFAAMQVGDELEEQIGLKNDSPLPILWAEFEDRSNIPGYTVSSARAAEPRSQVEWRAHTICMQRGVYNLGPWELRLGEPLGIFTVRQVYLQRQEILVYPPLAALPESVLPHRGALGDHRPLNQPLRAETIASSSVRAYAPGDPLRHIHWPTTARRSEPFVKVFAPEAASNIWLVPDFSAEDHVGEGADSSLETMVTVVASLAAELLQQHLSVGMFASADRETVVLPRQGQSHLWTVLQELAPLAAAPQGTLEDSLSRARALVSGNDLLILVTPSLRPDWITALRRISRSRGSRGRAEVILLDPVSFGGQGSAENFLPTLIEQGITANILRREDVKIISGTYGEISRWEFSVSGTGRAVVRKMPRLAAAMAENKQASGINMEAQP